MPYAYAFDPTGLSPANKITGEQQILTAPNHRNYHFIVPHFAPFFSDSLVISYRDLSNNVRTLVEGIDYYCAFQFVGASRACAKPIYGGISFLDVVLSGVVTIQYQTVGGEWVIDSNAIAEILSDTLRNPRTTTWEQVASVPNVFPPVDHEWNLQDMVGMSDVSNKVEEIALNIAAKPAVSALAGIDIYPTKNQIGLGNVDNFKTASDAEAVAGSSVSRFMTPRGVKKAIDNLLATLNNGVATLASLALKTGSGLIGSPIGQNLSKAILTVDNIAALRAISKTGLNASTAVNVLGYYTPGDNGGGTFYWNATSTIADNIGTIIIPDELPSAGRWLRVIREDINVHWFGALGDGVTNDTGAIQAAINYIKNNKGTLLFLPLTYLVSNVNISNYGNNTRHSLNINGNGATIKGDGSFIPFTMYRVKGIAITGLNVEKNILATYAVKIDSVWTSIFKKCNFNETILHSDDNWGLYWNEFNGCYFSSIYFDLTNFSINQNIWTGGQVGTISKSDALSAIFKEAYNNVFIGVDILGPVDWRDPSTSFHDPLVFRDCNMEYSGTNYGYIISTGGKSIPSNNSTYFFPWDDLRSEFNTQYSGGYWSTGWLPWNNANLFRGGACQIFSPDLAVIGVGSNNLQTYLDTSSPTGNNYCYRLYFSSESWARCKISMPIEFLDIAKKVGFVSFSFMVKNVNGAIIIANNTGVIPGGDQYPSGITFPTNQWVQRFVTVPVKSTDTEVSVHIGGTNVSGFDVRLANIVINLGKIARPYCPCPNEPHPKRAVSFQKSLIANNTSQDTFSLTVPNKDIVGRLRIKASCITSDSVSVYEGVLNYSKHNSSGLVKSSIVLVNKSENSWGGAATGTISAMSVSVIGSVITVLTNITTYSASPSRLITYEVEFLDNNENLTVL